MKEELNKDMENIRKKIKQQKQVNGRNYHIPLNINTECQWIQLPPQRHCLAKWIKKDYLTTCYLQKLILLTETLS
jgi:hypothetical protein